MGVTCQETQVGIKWNCTAVNMDVKNKENGPSVLWGPKCYAHVCWTSSIDRVLVSWTGQASGWAACSTHENHSSSSAHWPETRAHFLGWNRVVCWWNVSLLHVSEDLSCHKCFPALSTFNSVGSPLNHSKTGWWRSSWFTHDMKMLPILLVLWLMLTPGAPGHSPFIIVALSFLDPWNPLKSGQFKWLNPGTPPYVRHPFNWACRFCSSVSLSWGCRKLTQEALYL